MPGEPTKDSASPSDRLPPTQVQDLIPVVTPIGLEVGPSLAPFVDPSQDGGRFLEERLPFVREGIFFELGIILPGLKARVNPGLAEGVFTVELDEVPRLTGKAELRKVLVNETVERLEQRNIEGQPAVVPGRLTPCAWVDQAHQAALEEAGVTTWDAPEYLMLSLANVVRRNARQFVSVEEVQTAVHRVTDQIPALVEAVMGRVGVVTLTEVCRRLVDEEVSIRNLKGILQALVEGPLEPDPATLTEQVRWSMRHSICHKHSLDGVTRLFALDVEIEAALRKTRAGLALRPEKAARIIAAIERECGELLPRERLIVTTAELRPLVRRLLAPAFSQPFGVISHEEVVPDILRAQRQTITLEPRSARGPARQRQKRR